MHPKALPQIVTFQSTPSRRGRHPNGMSCSNAPGVSIHALAKRATCGVVESCLISVFQSTPSRRGRQSVTRENMLKYIVSIHALAKRATLGGSVADLLANVSIHALAKRATFNTLIVREGLAVSIHALAKRATANRPARLQWPGCFNPRPREEGDPPIQHLPRNVGSFNPRPREEGDSTIAHCVRLLSVSIHALAKRATHN